MAENVGKSSFEVAVHFDLRDLNIRTVSAFDQLLGGLSTVLDNLFGVAAQEDFAYRLLVMRRMLGLREVPG